MFARGSLTFDWRSTALPWGSLRRRGAALDFVTGTKATVRHYDWYDVWNWCQKVSNQLACTENWWSKFTLLNFCILVVLLRNLGNVLNDLSNDKCLIPYHSQGNVPKPSFTAGHRKRVDGPKPYPAYTCNTSLADSRRCYRFCLIFSYLHLKKILQKTFNKMFTIPVSFTSNLFHYCQWKCRSVQKLHHLRNPLEFLYLQVHITTYDT